MRQKAKIHKQTLNKTWRWWQAMATHPIPLPCGLALTPPSHRDASTPSPCWAPHLMSQEHIMFSNPTPSTGKPRLSPAATMSDDTLSALTPSLHCTSILHSATPPQFVALESWTISALICVNRFTFAGSQKSDFWTCACVFTFSFRAHTASSKPTRLFLTKYGKALCNLLPVLFCQKWTSALSPCLQFGRYCHSDSTITFTFV